MRQERRDRAQQIATELQGRPVDEVRMMIELVALQYELSKDTLVNAVGEDLLRIQGEARAFERLHKLLTRTASANKE
jgi:hypothetical protein